MTAEDTQLFRLIFSSFLLLDEDFVLDAALGLDKVAVVVFHPG